LRVEVKGWPTKSRYADPARAGEIRRAQPSTQAAHWFSQALLHGMRDLGRHRDDLVAIGPPDWPRFRSLLVDRPRTAQVGGRRLFVQRVGAVQERLSLPG
jgi:hypothetical protein